MAMKNQERFQAMLDDVAREIVATIHRPDASYIRTPVLYPSGANAVVRIDGGPNEYFVSDFGMGFQEAEMMGASSVYARHARPIAENAGVGFDQHSFFVLKATREQLPGAVVTIANCSQEAVTIAMYKYLERKAEAAAANLYEKLVSIFPPKTVERNPELRGASTTPYHVAAIVHRDKNIAVFDPVVAHHTSISNVVMKFHDLARLERPPIRVSVVKKKAPFKTYLTVLSQAGNVIEVEAAKSTYEKAAA